MKQYYLIFCFLFYSSFLFSQTDTTNKIDENGYNVFYYENRQIASEGNMENGKPNGYWKTYYENGILKSSGNRKNYLLDSTWKFYNDSGKIVLEVNYLKDLKHGKRITYSENEIIEENFKKNVKNGFTNIYYKNYILKKSTPFKDGYEDGVSKKYSKDGRVITIFKYKKGFLVDRIKINRKDSKEKKHGKWKWFYDNGVVKSEGYFLHGKKNGYFKLYTREGDLLNIEKWKNNEKLVDVAELAKLEIKKEYYANGTIKAEASYKNNKPEGIRREYNKNGKIVASYIFNEGKKIAEGIIDEEGIRDGKWKEFYNKSGELRAVGEYDKGKKIGEWKFYFKNGNLEQIGKYNKKGYPEERWIWYYKLGNILREENYYLGKRDGLMVEYDENEKIITKGEYFDGVKEGEWFYKLGNYMEKGNYASGQRYGKWKHYDDEDNLLYEGKYIDGNRQGDHFWYRKDGTIKEKTSYMMGRKTGKSVKYNIDGTPFLIITYKNGKEIKYDGVDIY